MKTERGSATLIVSAALGLGAILAALSVDLSLVIGARVRAQTAADSAALAAAQELIVPSALSPGKVAQEYASRHGAEVTDCDCRTGQDEVLVSVSVAVNLPFFGEDKRVIAQARAVVEPQETAGLASFFATRLQCLFAKVPGLTIVSGFRTHAEQAALYDQKPELAAPPGHSMHELGLAADLGYPSDAARDRAHVAAPSCGLVFPVSHEPWHIEPAAS
ncbi:MAG: Rv3654c family TadE-like protein [Actinomycetota bacterium]